MKPDHKNDGNIKGNESDDEQWESKLVIDLDENMSSGDRNSSANIVPSTPTTVKSEPKDQPQAAESDTQNESDSLDKSSSSTASIKAKVKRGGAKTAKNEQAKANQTNGTTQSKTTKALKSDSKTVTPKGRKKKDKTLSKNAGSNESNDESKTEHGLYNTSTDPYEFQGPDEEGISSTTYSQKVMVKNENVNSKSVATEYDQCTTGTAVEPEVLGPCEPGTHVSLDGIVWQETTNGVLVVNVTWRGKTYMGTLLDATKHEWAPPRSCDSPTSDFDGRTPKARGKRTRVPLSDTFKDINERKMRKEMRRQTGQSVSQPPPSPVKSETGKRRGRTSECDTTEPTSKRGRAASRNSAVAPTSPVLIECPEPNCGKKYKHNNGLRYHMTHAHQEVSNADGASDTEKSELSPVEKKPRKKTKAEKKTKLAASPVDESSKSDESRDGVKVEVKPEPSESTSIIPETVLEDDQPTSSLPTSVITATPLTSTPATPVPIATISPQVMKQPQPADLKPGSTISRNIPAVPPKLLPKASGSLNTSMAPISTISSHSMMTNPSLKPIQPKPTILGEVKPNPALSDLRDQKKLKRKRSASKEDLTIIADGARSITASNDLQRLGHLEQDRPINTHLRDQPLGDNSNPLQSPSYSDISDEGDRRREPISGMPKPVSIHSNLSYPGVPSNYNQVPYRIATVTPQKNSPDVNRQHTEHSSTSSHYSSRQSPAPKPQSDSGKPREPVELQQQQQQMHNMLWPGQSPEQMMIHHMLVGAGKHTQTVSPKPNAHRTSPKLRESDSQASNERLQLLKENMEVRSQMPSASNDTPKDYSMSSSRAAEDRYMRAQRDQKIREREDRERKKEPISRPPTHSPHPMQSRDPLRDDRPSHQRNSTSPAPGGFPLMSPFLPFQPNQMLAGGMNPLMAQNLPPGFPFAAYPGMAMVDSKGMPVNPFVNKGNSHKIHELEEMARSSKSPKGPGANNTSDKERPLSAHSVAAKNQAYQQQQTQAMYAAMQNGMGMFHQK